MKLIWKLLRQHISIAQFIGFVLANLCGVFIILLALQFYKDIMPVIQGDTLMKKEYIILSKPVSTLGSVLGTKSGFSEKEIHNLRSQRFTKSVGAFKSSQFQVIGGIGAEQFGVSLPGSGNNSRYYYYDGAYYFFAEAEPAGDPSPEVHISKAQHTEDGSYYIALADLSEINVVYAIVSRSGTRPSSVCL